MSKRLFSVLLLTSIIVSLLPGTAVAQEEVQLDQYGYAIMIWWVCNDIAACDVEIRVRYLSYWNGDGLHDEHPPCWTNKKGLFDAMPAVYFDGYKYKLIQIWKRWDGEGYEGYFLYPIYVDPKVFIQPWVWMK